MLQNLENSDTFFGSVAAGNMNNEDGQRTMTDYEKRLEDALCSAICIMRNESEIARMNGRDRASENLKRWTDELISESGMDFEAVLTRERTHGNQESKQ